MKTCLKIWCEDATIILETSSDVKYVEGADLGGETRRSLGPRQALAGGRTLATPASPRHRQVPRLQSRRRRHRNRPLPDLSE